MDDRYTFECPVFHNFTEEDTSYSEYADEYFFQYTEDDNGLASRIPSEHSSQAGLGKPVRVPVTHQHSVDQTNDSQTQQKSSRLRSGGPNCSNSFRKPRPTCPSPKKSAKKSTDKAGQECDASSPSQNTRLQARLSQEDLTEHTSRNINRSSATNRSFRGRKASPHHGKRNDDSMKDGGSAQRTGRPGSARNSPPHGYSPRINHHSSMPSVYKTSEELELEKMAAMRAQLEKSRQISQNSYRKAIGNQAHMPVRSIKPTTMPQGFHFSTDTRLKNSGPASSTATSAECVNQFTSTLRSSKNPPQSKHGHQSKHCTRPQPFKLTQNKSQPVIGKFVSDAEKNANFSRMLKSDVPKKGDGSANRGRSNERTATRNTPQSPAFMSRGRSRPVRVLSREEREQLEFEKCQREQFKAHPVNTKVLQVANVGVPPVEVRPITTPQEFALTRRRSMSTGDLKAALEAAELEEHKRFQAKPVDKRILKGTIGVRPVETQPITVAQSPAFSLKNRRRPPTVIEQKEDHKAHPKRKPVPHYGIPYQPKREHTHTIPEPFSVDERSKEMLLRKQMKIEQILEQERQARVFHASGLPSFSPEELPPKQVKPTTKPEPFDLEIDKRGKGYQDMFQQKQLEEEKRLAQEAASFNANPATVIQKKAFQPKGSTKPLTEIDDFRLNTDARAVNREQYELRLKQHEAEIEAIKRQREEQHEREEKAAIAKLRQETVHQATGIAKYKPVIVKPSEAHTTVPKTPNFSQRFRTRRGSQ